MPETAEPNAGDGLRASKRTSAAMRLAFQEQYHGAIMAVLPALLTDYITDLRTTEDPEVRRKGIAYFSQVIGVEADKKQDVGAGRAVVTINFGGARPQQVTITEDIVQDVQAKRLDDEAEVDLVLTQEPSALLRRHQYVNDEVAEDAA